MGSMAALSELVKCTSMLNILSMLPLARAVTVTVKGTPGAAVEGALTVRIVTGVLHAAIRTNATMTAPNAHGAATRVA